MYSSNMFSINLTFIKLDSQWELTVTQFKTVLSHLWFIGYECNSECYSVKFEAKIKWPTFIVELCLISEYNIQEIFLLIRFLSRFLLTYSLELYFIVYKNLKVKDTCWIRVNFEIFYRNFEILGENSSLEFQGGFQDFPKVWNIPVYSLDMIFVF